MQKTTTDTTKKRILVIQSGPAEQKMLTTVFRGKYGLFFAGGVDQALQSGRSVPHKVVIFDAGSALPHDLSELTRFKSGNRQETPIILLASNNSAAIEMKVAEIGVFYHLIRPYPVNDLEELIEAALRYWKRIYGWKISGETG
jgi:PleD family two-component response regulator